MPDFDIDDDTSTEALLDVDMGFLDAYRRKPGQKDGEEPREGLEPQRTPAEPGHESAGQRGGGGTAGVPTAPVAAETAGPSREDAVPGPAIEDEIAPEPESAVPLPQPDEPDPTPASQDLMADNRDDVQSAATRGGGAATGPGGSSALPQSGFAVSGEKPAEVRRMPAAVLSALREQLRSAAVRELKVDDVDAREFVDKLGQASLVTAFLLAQLDVDLDTDPATGRAVQLFRSRDPLLGSVVVRMDRLEALERERARAVGKLREELQETRMVARSVEQSTSYLIADRTENFLRGLQSTRDAPLGDKLVVEIRDKSRAAAEKQERMEREREGRPIR